MATEVIMPKMGQTMEEGTILEWYRREGDTIEKGEPLFQVESDKAVFDIASTATGTVRQIRFPPGATVAVLTTVAIIGSPEEDLSSNILPTSAETSAADVAEGEAAPATPEAERAAAPLPPAPPEGRILASPRARRLAEEKGVDLHQVAGSGPQGRISEQDVIAYLEAQPPVTPTARRMAVRTGIDLADLTGTGPGGRISRADVEAAEAARATTSRAPTERAPTESRVVPLTGMRHLIAQRMAESAQTTAHLTLTTEADATELTIWVGRFRELLRDEEVTPGYNDLLLKIVAQALRDHPTLNARWIEGGGSASIELQSEINLGIAVDTERGLTVPVIRDVTTKGLREIAHQRRALTERALAGTLLPDDMAGGTFTLTNLGMFEIDAFTPLINLPQCAILGVGRIRPQPAVHQGEICIRQMMALSLTFDHRIVDGAPAARFLQQVKHLIEQPSLLLL